MLVLLSLSFWAAQSKGLQVLFVIGGLIQCSRGLRWFQNRYSMLITNVHSILPDNWAVQIIYNPEKKMAMEAVNYPGVQRHVSRGHVTLTPLPKALTKLKKKDLMTSLWFWNSLLADKGNFYLFVLNSKNVFFVVIVLIFGGGTVFCSNSLFDLNHFSSRFDYVGSPWNQHKGMGGDGGLSIRNRQLMLEIIKQTIDGAETRNSLFEELKKRFKNLAISRPANDLQLQVGVTGVDEDVYFVFGLILLQRQGHSIRIASKEETDAFAMNDVRATLQQPQQSSLQANQNTESPPFGAQGTLASLPDAVRVRYLEWCPEMKLFFPILHNPGCFGANPNPLACFGFLCEYGGLKCGSSRSSTQHFVDSKGINMSVSLNVVG